VEAICFVLNCIVGTAMHIAVACGLLHIYLEPEILDAMTMFGLLFGCFMLLWNALHFYPQRSSVMLYKATGKRYSTVEPSYRALQIVAVAYASARFLEGKLVNNTSK
jgi:hypothetical protein